MKVIILAVALSLQVSHVTTFYIVRHAEKVDNSDNPSLSRPGKERSFTLKNLLKNKGIDNIFVSNFLRTQQTAGYLARSLHITPKKYQNTDEGNEILVRKLVSFTGNHSILIVGHTNNIPAIIDSLMGSQQHIVIAENDFDNMYIITIKNGAPTRRKLKVTSYGNPSP